MRWLVISGSLLFSMLATSMASYRPDHPPVRLAKGHDGTLR
jgi:hypothetical protein